MIHLNNIIPYKQLSAKKGMFESKLNPDLIQIKSRLNLNQIQIESKSNPV